MKSIRNLITLLILVIAPMSAFSQSSVSPAYLKEMHKMLDACQIKEVLIQTVADSWKSMNVPMTDYNAAATALYNDLWEDIVKEYAVAYSKYFNIDDLKQINSFYETPTGKKFSKYSTLISADIQQIISTKYVTRMQNILIDYLK